MRRRRGRNIHVRYLSEEALRVLFPETLLIWVARNVSQIKPKSGKQRKTNLKIFGGVEISFTLVGLCSDVVFITFCSSSRGSKISVPVIALNVFLRCLVLLGQTHPSVPKYL